MAMSTVCGCGIVGALILCASAITSHAAAQTSGAYQIYQYDSLGRLTGAWDSLGRNATSTYDNADNRLHTQVTSAIPPTAPNPPSAPIAGFRVIKITVGTVTKFVVVPFVQ